MLPIRRILLIPLLILILILILYEDDYVKIGRKIMMPAYLLPEQHAALKVLSKSNGRPMQEFLREGIGLVLAKYKKKRK